MFWFDLHVHTLCIVVLLFFSMLYDLIALLISSRLCFCLIRMLTLPPLQIDLDIAYGCLVSVL